MPNFRMYIFEHASCIISHLMSDRWRRLSGFDGLSFGYVHSNALGNMPNIVNNNRRKRNSLTMRFVHSQSVVVGLPSVEHRFRIGQMQLPLRWFPPVIVSNAKTTAERAYTSADLPTSQLDVKCWESGKRRSCSQRHLLGNRTVHSSESNAE